MTRRFTAMLALALVTACAPVLDNVPIDPLHPAGAVAVPPEGAYFGTQFSSSVTDRRQAMRELEDRIGRKFAIDHVYHQWDSSFPTDYDRWTVRQGRILFLSWTSRLESDGAVAFDDITSGRYDDVIDRRAREIAALGAPVLLSFGHEPSDLIGDPPMRSGTTAGYRDAWRYLVQRFDKLGVDNVSWVWTLTAYSFENGTPYEFYPGDGIVDWVGVDGYVNVHCPWIDVDWQSWIQLFSAAEDFAEMHAKPLIVAEFGLGEDPNDPDRKARWLKSAARDIANMPNLKAIVSFNSEETCASPIASSPASLAGYKAMGQADVLAPMP